MPKTKTKSPRRMVVHVPASIQMAVKLRSAKSGLTTGDVITMAMLCCYPEECNEAKKIVEDANAK